MRILTRSFILLTALLASASCAQFEDAEKGYCNGAKCDDTRPSEQGEQVLMQKSPPGETAISRNKAGKWLFHTIGNHGETVLSSQAYVARASAANGILAVEQAGVDLNQYKVVEAEGGKKYRFILRAKGNYQEIASSRLFDTSAQAQANIQGARDLIASVVQFKAGVEKGARFDLRRKENRAWHFTLVDADGTELLFSQDYQGRTSAVNGIMSVRKNGKIAARYAYKGKYFILIAGNYREIARSKTFDQSADTLKTLQRVKALLESERVSNPW